MIPAASRLHSASVVRNVVFRPLLFAMLCMMAFSAGAVDSMSNKVTTVEAREDGNILRVGVATGIYHTRGSTRDQLNIDPHCSLADGEVITPNDRYVILRFDASDDPPDSIEREIITQTIEAAREGPYRTIFTIVQNECSRFGDTGPHYPVATGVKLIQVK